VSTIDAAEGAMTLKSLPWYPIALVLGGLNLIGVGWAAGVAEPAHATVHVALALACWSWAKRMRPGRDGSDRQERLDELEAELSDMRGELSETQERMDFAERLLAQGSESRRVGPDH
jgi:hypothetical protein